MGKSKYLIHEISILLFAMMCCALLLRACEHSGGNKYRHSLPEGLTDSEVRRMCTEQHNVRDYIVYDNTVFCTKNHYAIDGQFYKLNLENNNE